MRELLIEQLLQNSNHYLENLSSRYYLRRQEANGLGLEIEDLLQHKSRRAVNTLAGGESFLVSLALALGLSDIAASGRRI